MKIDHFRIQVYEGIVRIEYSKGNQFYDNNSFFVPNRYSFGSLLDCEIEELADCYQVPLEGRTYFLCIEKGVESLDAILVKDAFHHVVYRYQKLENSGELSLPEETPTIFPLIDSPRITMPKSGYSLKTVEMNRKPIVEENVNDLYLIFCKNNPRLLRKLFVKVAGRTEMPSLSSLGVFSSRYYAYNQEEAKQMILEYEKRDIPLDNIVIDTDWRKSSKRGIGYDINEELFPDMEEFFTFAHDHGVKVLFNDHPEPQTEDGDIFSKEEMKYRIENLSHLLNMGLDFWWYDRNWICKLNSFCSFVKPETAGQYLFFDITKQVNQTKKINGYPKRVELLSNVNDNRNGHYVKIQDSATHRYSIQWTGDTYCKLSDLDQEIINHNKASLNAIPYENSDLGGHIGNPNKHDYLLWMGFGVFDGLFRPHCTKTVERFREPWNYDEETVSLFREFTLTRYRLLPTLYKEAYLSYQEGTSLTMPISFEHQVPKIYSLRESYLADTILFTPYTDTKETPLLPSMYQGKVHSTYFDNRDLQGKPILETEEKRLGFKIDGTKLHGVIPPYNFSAVYEFDIMPKSDIILHLLSDDGMRVFVDNTLVKEDWTCHAATDYEICELKGKQKYHIRIEYFQGEGAAILHPFFFYKRNIGKREIYFPDGKYVDPYSGKEFNGNKVYHVRLNEKKIPMYIKDSRIIFLARNTRHALDSDFKNLLLDVYPGKESFSTMLYEDDGVSEGYLVNQCRITHCSYSFEEGKASIHLDKSQGTFRGKRCCKKRKITLRINHLFGFDNVKEVLINGERVKVKHHRRNQSLPALSFSESNCACKTSSLSLIQDVTKEYDIVILFD